MKAHQSRLLRIFLSIAFLYISDAEQYLKEWRRPLTLSGEIKHLWKPNPSVSGVVLKLIPQNDPESPLKVNFKNGEDQMEYFINQDENRMEALLKKRLQNSKKILNRKFTENSKETVLNTFLSKRLADKATTRIPPPLKRQVGQTPPPPTKKPPPPPTKKPPPPPTKKPPPPSTKKPPPPPPLKSPSPPLNKSPPSPSPPSKKNFTQDLTNRFAIGGIFLVSVALGTPAVKQMLLFDTASDLNWVQCKACGKYCYSQEYPLFDHTKSSTFSSVSCTNPVCRDPDLDGSRNITYPACISSTNKTCQYLYYYGTGQIYGVLGSETFSLNTIPSGSPPFKLPNVTMGCTLRSNDIDGFSGILATGRGPLSFARQISPYLSKSVFSTCITPVNLINATSQVVYGPAAIPTGSVSYTPVKSSPYEGSQTFFYVSVVKVLVGGVTVNIPSIVWNFNSIYGGGVLFDTGTSLGYLDKRAWLPIFTEVDNQISAQNYEDVDQYYYYAGIHFCWLNSTGSRFPTIEFQFEGGAKLRMDPYIYLQHPFLLSKAPSNVLCSLIFPAPEGFGSIFGALTMQNQLVVWDLSENRLGFKPTNCATGKSL